MTIAKKIATNNNNVDTANKNSYIFTTYSTRTGFDSNGYTNDVESIEIKCDTLGNADTFNGLYREVVFFDADRKNGWDIKTTDGKILAKGTTEDELRKAYDNLAKAEVTTATDNTNAPEVARFQKGKTYRYYDTNTGEPLWYITVDKRTNTTVTVSGEKFEVFIQPHDRLLNYDKPTESFICGKYRIDATDACEETADEITPSTLQKFIEAKKEVSYWRNSNGARIWQIAYIRYGVNDGIVGQTPWLNCTIKEADRYLKDEYGMTLLEYLAAEDKWNDTDKGAILKDKIERDCKPSVEPMPALYPAEDSDDDDELIDPPATTPADDFATKLAELKAKQDAAKTAELAAKKVYKEASDKYVECQEATQKFLDAHADKLTEKINTLEIESYITMVRDNGKERYDVFSTNQLNVDAFNGFGKMFIVRCRGNELGTYDTPAQIEVVINQLKAAVERGDREFKFPTVDELNKPEIDKDATADSLTRAMTIALEKYQDFCRVGNLTAAANELRLYNICRKAMTELWKGEAA